MNYENKKPFVQEANISVKVYKSGEYKKSINLSYSNIKINETAADANADGKLEAFDASLVLQKCAGWDIVLGPKAE